MSRALYTVDGTEGNIVFLIDLSVLGGMSITNDAEAVVKEVNSKYPGMRIVYTDSMDEVDELLHTDGVFRGFAPYNPNKL